MIFIKYMFLMLAKREKKMKPIIIIIITVVCSVLCFFCGLIIGVNYPDKSSGIPKDGNFEMSGYFTNIQKKDELTIIDGEYPYFTNDTGASEEEAKDYKNHPENYEEYEVELVITNFSSHKLSPVWAVLPGYQADYESVKIKDLNSNVINRKIWINCWLNAGATSLEAGETYKTKITIIVKNAEMNDQEVLELLMHLQINLQLGICEKSLNPEYDISRNISFNYPIFYKEL